MIRALTLIGLFLLLSCNESKTSTVLNQSQNGDIWQLTAMKSNVMIPDTPDNPEEEPLPYAEHYTFKEDYTFIKSRSSQEGKIEGDGTYKTITAGEGVYYTLTYNQSNFELIGGCSGPQTETLLMKPNGKMQNSWAMCDGPFKQYEKF